MGSWWIHSLSHPNSLCNRTSPEPYSDPKASLPRPSFIHIHEWRRLPGNRVTATYIHLISSHVITTFPKKAPSYSAPVLGPISSPSLSPRLHPFPIPSLHSPSPFFVLQPHIPTHPSTPYLNPNPNHPNHNIKRPRLPAIVLVTPHPILFLIPIRSRGGMHAGSTTAFPTGMTITITTTATTTTTTTVAGGAAVRAARAGG